MKFSTRSSNRDGSQVPRSIVSREITPFSDSSSIFFHSEKCYHPPVIDPIFDWVPFDRMMNAFGVNSEGIVSR